MVREDDTEHVEGFALKPVSGGKHSHCRRYRYIFLCLKFHPHAPVLRDRQQVIDDIKSLGALRPIDAADINQNAEGKARVVAQVLQHIDNSTGLYIES